MLRQCHKFREAIREFASLPDISEGDRTLIDLLSYNFETGVKVYSESQDLPN